MGNRPYLRTILGGTDFKSLSLMEKIICINVGYYGYANIM